MRRMRTIKPSNSLRMIYASREIKTSRSQRVVLILLVAQTQLTSFAPSRTRCSPIDTLINLVNSHSDSCKFTCAKGVAQCAMAYIVSALNSLFIQLFHLCDSLRISRYVEKPVAPYTIKEYRSDTTGQEITYELARVMLTLEIFLM